MDMKPLPQPSLDVFCAIYSDAKGRPDTTCPADGYNNACLRACERRGLIVWDTERIDGKTRRWCALTALGAKWGCEGVAHVSDDTKQDGRNRQWVRMQFDINKPDYADAYEVVGELVEDNLLAETVRDLLLIHKAAETGDYRLFYELYGIPETKETRQFEAMFSVMERMQSTIDELTEKVKLQANPQSPETAPAHGLRKVAGQADGNAPRTLDVPQFDVPVYDDDEDESLLSVQADTDAGRRASENFLKSIMGLLGD